MFLVLCKLVHSGEVASLGKIAFFQTARFSKGSMAVHATWKASGSLCLEVMLDEFGQLYRETARSL